MGVKLMKNYKLLECNYRSSADVYDALSDTWTRAANSTLGRQGTSLINIYKRLLAVGGLGTALHGVVEEYLPDRNEW